MGNLFSKMIFSLLLTIVSSLSKGSCVPPKLSCATATDAAVCNTISGCDWLNGSEGYCGAVTLTECHSVGSKSDCNAKTGCAWDDGGQCNYPSCSTKAKTDCTGACMWNSSSASCLRFGSNDCMAISAQTECEAEGIGCEMVSAKSRCLHRNDCSGLSESSCESEVGCMWKVNNSCGWVNETCRGISETMCKDDNHTGKCEWSGPFFRGVCAINFESVCSSLAKAECEANDICSYLPSYDLCYMGNCRDNSDGTDCNTASKELGCHWRSALLSGTCNLKNCYSNEAGDGCRNTSISAGCKWKTAGYCTTDYSVSCTGNSEDTCNSSSGCIWQEGRSQCSVDLSSNVTCFKNAAGTDCDTAENGVDIGCKFSYYAGVCIENDLVKCNKNYTKCDDASSAVGCVWEGSSGDCKQDQRLICSKNGVSDGCDPASTSIGCTWKAATTGSCVNGVSCVGNENGNGCSDYSTSIGCTWSDDSDSARLISFPNLLFLGLIVMCL